MVLDVASKDANNENVSKSVSDNEKVNKTTIDRDESKREYLHFCMKSSYPLTPGKWYMLRN